VEAALSIAPRLAILLAATLTFGATSAHAEQSAASAAAKGRIAPVSLQVTDASLPAPARKALAAKMDGLIARALATPAFHDPHGFSLTRTVRIHEPDALATAPARAEATLIAQDIDLESGAKPDATGAYMGRLEGPSFRIAVNDLLVLYANLGGREDAVREAQHLQMPMTLVQGFPMFRVGIRDVVLVTKPGRLPYVHVTKGEHLQQLLDATRESVAASGGPVHPKLQATLDRQMAELAALTPQERAAPACVSARLRQSFGDCAEKFAVFYVRPNPDYFDKGAPRTAVQLVAISTPAEGGHGHKRLEPVMRAAGAAIDYRAIQAGLD
jgi:hypothetical protein